MPIKEKMETITEKVGNPPQINFIKSRKLSKKWLIILGFSFFLLVVLILASILLQNGPAPSQPGLEITPTPTPFKQNLGPPSPYATDSAILQIEKGLDQLEENLIKIDLYESELNPPALDMRVRF